MNISSLSLNFVNHCTTSLQPATAGRLPTPVSKGADREKDGADDHSAGRSNRLTQALTAALREIGIGGTASAPGTPGAAGTAGTSTTADTSGTAAASAAAPPAAGDLNAAVEQFAHALMDALGAGRGARRHVGEHRIDGDRVHHGHSARNTRYGDLAQRLESLSQTVVQAPPTAQVPAAPATAVAPVTAAPLSLPPTVESETNPVASPLAAPAPARAATSPLLEAFTRLFDALKPRTAADAPATNMATRLQQFLHTVAQTLSHTGLDSAAALQTGSFIDVKA